MTLPFRQIAIAGAGLIAATSAIAAPDALKGKFGTLEVVQAGSEEALSFDDQVIGRPFGAELIDTLEIVGRHQVGGDDVYIVRGGRGGDCPSRYVAVTARRGGPPTVSQPFGTCAAILSSRNRGGLTVTMPDRAGTPVTYAYAGGEMRPNLPVTAGPVATAVPQTCRLYGQAGTSPQEGAALIASFERGYPRALRRGGRVDKAGLTREQLQEMVIGMACLATWPGADPLVPETARPLFRNRRYGGDAFAMLDAVARAPDTAEPLRAAVRAFAAKMYYQASIG